MYFEDRFPEEFEITPDPTLINRPRLIRPEDLEKFPAPGQPLTGADFQHFVDRVCEEIAAALDLQKVTTP